MLTRYKAWADDLSYETATKLSGEELLKERQTTFKTIAHTCITPISSTTCSRLTLRGEGMAIPLGP